MEKVCIICYQIFSDLCSFAPFACIFWDRLFRLCFRERFLEVKLQRFSYGQSNVVMAEGASQIKYFFRKRFFSCIALAEFNVLFPGKRVSGYNLFVNLLADYHTVPFQ